MQPIAIILLIGISFFMGAITFLMYLVLRMLRSDGWDSSNMTNALRLLSHVTLHPEDFGRLYYLTHKQLTVLANHPVAAEPLPKRPFWYVDLDELSEVVDSRPDVV